MYPILLAFFASCAVYGVGNLFAATVCRERVSALEIETITTKTYTEQNAMVCGLTEPESFRYFSSQSQEQCERWFKGVLRWLCECSHNAFVSKTDKSAQKDVSFEVFHGNIG
jgi:hypothetical protein